MENVEIYCLDMVSTTILNRIVFNINNTTTRICNLIIAKNVRKHRFDTNRIRVLALLADKSRIARKSEKINQSNWFLL